MSRCGKIFFLATDWVDKNQIQPSVDVDAADEIEPGGIDEEDSSVIIQPIQAVSLARIRLWLICSLAAGACGQLAAPAATIWTGPLITFNQSTPYSNPPSPGDRDQLTSSVSLTRGIPSQGSGAGGIFNDVTETFFTKNFSVAAEVGMDHFDFNGESKTRSLVKKTVALQWSPQSSFWSRPQIRIFATKANWNAEANNWGNVAANVFAPNAVTGVTYGAQVEAWW